jgi:hypothetical protein
MASAVTITHPAGLGFGFGFGFGFSFGFGFGFEWSAPRRADDEFGVPRAVPTLEGRRLSQDMHGAPYYEVSSATGGHVADAFEEGMEKYSKLKCRHSAVVGLDHTSRMRLDVFWSPTTTHIDLLRPFVLGSPVAASFPRVHQT